MTLHHSRLSNNVFFILPLRLGSVHVSVYDTSEYLVGDPSAWIMVLDVNEGYSTLPRFLAWLESDVKK